jgi:hypothetical protein
MRWMDSVIADLATMGIRGWRTKPTKGCRANWRRREIAQIIQNWMIRWLLVNTNWKGCWRKQSWPNLRFYPDTCLAEPEKSTKYLRIANFRAEARVQELANTTTLGLQRIQPRSSCIRKSDNHLTAMSAQKRRRDRQYTITEQWGTDWGWQNERKAGKRM